MSLEEVRGFVTLAGVVVQAVGSLLLLMLFALLQRRAGREFFVQWASALGLIVLASGLVMVRHLLLGETSAWPLADQHVLVQGIYAGHQFCALGALVLFLSGAASYAQLTLPARPRRILLGAAAVAALAPIVRGGELADWLIWFAPLAAVFHGWSGWLLLRAPEESRGLGTRLASGAFLVGASFWTSYVVCFPFGAPMGDPTGFAALATLVLQYYTYIDFLVIVFLAFGMVVALLEEAAREIEAGKRRVDDAHQSLARAHDRLRRLALYDPLTGCLNRQGFAERHGRAANAPSRAGTVLVVDMDNLKPCNDNFGHDAGDAMLRYLARTLQGRAPSGTTIYRWGGDEFLLIIPDMKPAEAQAHFAKAVLEAPPITPPGADRPLTLEASVGAAQFRNAAELDDAIKRADRGMYVQKAGRKMQSNAHPVTLA